MSEVRARVGGVKGTADSDVKFVKGTSELEAQLVSEGDAELDSDVRILQGGRPFQPGGITTVDHETMEGDGTVAHPLKAIGGGHIPVVVDNVSIGGDGTNEHPLHTLPDGTKVLTDGTTILGSGVTGDPLVATGGGPGSTNVTPYQYTVLGTEPDLAQITVTLVPSQPDGNYKVAVEQGAHAFLLGHSVINKLGGSLVLQLSGEATAGDVFDITVTRAA